MALKQSRRTVSFNRELFERAKSRAAADGKSLASWVGELVAAALDGRLVEPLPEPVDASFCALCTNERGPFVLRPLGKAGASVAVCRSCDGEHPRSGRYGFDGGGRESGSSVHLGRSGTNGSRGAVQR